MPTGGSKFGTLLEQGHTYIFIGKSKILKEFINHFEGHSGSRDHHFLCHPVL